MSDVILRGVTAADEDFLVGLYATTRPEVAMFGWDEAEQHAFIRMQFDMQRRSYAMQSPTAEHSVIAYEGRNAGRLIVERSATSLSLTDIAILPEFRQKGIATLIIKRLQDEAERTGRSIELTVERMNVNAFQLYRKLGFEVTGENQLHLAMKWTPKDKQGRK